MAPSQPKPRTRELPAGEQEPARVLVIQTAFLGDIVLATSFLANLRRLLPQAEILVLTTPAGAGILAGNTAGARPMAYDKRGTEAGPTGFWRKARALRGFAPHLVFCLHRSLRSALLARLAGGESWGFREAAGSGLLFHHPVARPRGAYEAEKNHALLLAWAGPQERELPLFPELRCSPPDEEEAHALLAGVGGGFAALAPGSVWATKRWPAERFAGVAHRLWKRRGLRSVVVGGREPADRDAAQVLLRAYASLAGAGDPPPLDLTGKTGLGALKSVLSRAAIVVANDSAPLHIAVAMGARVVGIFGPTTKELGFFPLAPAGRSAVAEVGGLDCRPCGLHGHHRCPRGHFRCMLDLDPDLVLKEAEELLCHP